MSDPTDFIALYNELGIEPDCTVDELRMAYRRRVADLHPDRGGASDGDALKSLNLRYASALEFHRHYGRLPGAAPVSQARPRPAAVEPPRWEEAPLPEPGARRPSRVVVWGIVLLAILVVWWMSRTDAGLPGFQGAGVAVSKRQTTSRTAISLRQGMPAAEVLAMLGEPVSRELGGTQWLYGPSWVRLECNEVIDWYSSPLHPLRASRARPTGDEATIAAAAGTRRCPPGSSTPHNLRYAP